MKPPINPAKKYTKTSALFIFITLISIILVQHSISKTGPDQVFTKKLIEFSDQIRNKTYTPSELKPNRLYNNMTLILREARRNWEKLTPHGKDYFYKLLQRPDSLDQTYEPTPGFFKLWYTNSDSDAVDQTDKNNNNVPDYVENMADILETVRAKYDSTGFTMPPPDQGEGGNDKYDVYISNTEAGEGVYGYVSVDANLGDNPNSSDIQEQDCYASHMVLRNNYDDFGDTEQIRNNSIKVTCAHEFSHAVQFGYGTHTWDENKREYVELMSGFVVEGCAVWAEDWVFPGIDDNFQFLEGVFAGPDGALNWNNESESANFEDIWDYWYCTWIYFRYLTELKYPDKLDPELIKNLFIRTLTTRDIKAIDEELKSNYGSDLISSVKNFYTACALLTENPSNAPFTFNRANDYRTYLNFFDYNGVIDEKVLYYKGSILNHDSETDGDGRLMRLGADFFGIIPDQNFSVKLASKNNADSLFMIILKMNAPINPTTAVIVNAEKSGNDQIVNVIDKQNYSNFKLIVMNTKTKKDTLSVQYNLTIDKAKETGIDMSENIVPKKIHLYHNYPNPFNPTTKIRFDLNNNTNIRLDLIDISGRIVTRLYRGLKKAGKHEIIFNSEHQTSGTYFIRLQAGKEVQTQKITLIR